jgi:hypothetical protein
MSNGSENVPFLEVNEWRLKGGGSEEPPPELLLLLNDGDDVLAGLDPESNPLMPLRLDLSSIGGENIASLHVSLLFDESVLEFNTATEPNQNGLNCPVAKKSPGRVDVGPCNFSPITQSQIIKEIGFKGKQEGSTSIKLDVKSIENDAGKELKSFLQTKGVQNYEIQTIAQPA